MRESKRAKVKVAFGIIWKMDRRLMIYSFIAAVIESLVPCVGIFLSAYVLDGLGSGERLQKLLTVSIISVFAIFLLTVLLSYMKKLKEIHIHRCKSRYDTLMSMKTVTMDYPLLDSPEVNEIRERIRHDNEWGAGFYSLVWQLPWLLENVLSFVISFVVMLPLFLKESVFTDRPALLLMVFFVAVILFYVWFDGKRNKEMFNLLDDSALDKSYFSYFLWKGQDYHYGKDVRIYDTKKLIESKIAGDVSIKKKWMGKLISNNMQSGFWGNFSAGFLQAVSYLFVVVRASAGALSVGDVVKYAGVIYRLSQSISNAFTALEEFGISGGRQISTLEYLELGDALAKGKLPVEKRAFCNGGDNEYEIEFQDVSFRYPGSDTYALSHINLRFHVGSRMAVVGKNGSGKTTLIKLLCRLYDPTEGEILLNGINIKKYDYEEYLRIFAVVFQDFKLFSFGLGQNVAAGVDFDQERAGACLEKAGAGELLEKMPAGFTTCLFKDFEGDGVEISGGEAQKIALARALYKEAPFIILDEPTAALDPVGEYEIYSRFNEIVEDKTAIYISHRLSSCRFCDEIVVFDEGKIIQQGSHETLLLDKKGKYHELWYAQAQYYR